MKRVNMVMAGLIYMKSGPRSTKTWRSIFSEKKAPAAVHHTHTGHKNTRNVIFSEKKAPAAVHHTHTGHKNPRQSG